MNSFRNVFRIFILFFIISLLLGCFPYLYYDQDKVFIEGVDIDQTIEIGKIELEEGGFDSILTIWAIRDQAITPKQALKISELYFKYIDQLEGDFEVWHYAWAISDFYRNGNEQVKKAVEKAYLDAKKRPATMKKFMKIADKHINGKKIYMGDIHGLGRKYARTHIVVPGNKKYVQSLEEFIDKKTHEKNKKE